MSKIICDVCGTSYPETAMQCPICGCVRPGDVKIVVGDTNQPEERQDGAYTHIKGGRFSKANVRKRNEGKLEPKVVANKPKKVDNSKPAADKSKPAADKKSKDTPRKSYVKPSDPNKKGLDIGLTITVIVLLLAIIAVSIFIVVKFFIPASSGNPDDTKPVATTTENDTTVTEPSEETEPSEDITDPDDPTDPPVVTIELHADDVYLDEVGETIALVVSGVPEGQSVTYTIDNPDVATISDDGVITAVASGETFVVIECGDAKTECKVVCEIPEPVVHNYQTNKASQGNEVTIRVGEEFQLLLLDLDNDMAVVDVQWMEDDGYCTIDGNWITGAVSTNNQPLAEVYTIIDGVRYYCIIRIR